MDRSVDSIGSCSLDVDADSTDFSDTSGELNFLTPNSAKDIQREFTAGIKERCKLPVINCQAVTTVLDPVTGNISTVLTTTSPLAETAITTTAAAPSKKPSYLNLACCVNGYSNLTTYDSKLRQDINKSREVSPNRPIIATLHYNRSSGEGGNFQLTAPTLSYISMNNTINNNISSSNGSGGGGGGRLSNGSSTTKMVNGSSGMAGAGRFSTGGGQDLTDNASMFNGNGFGVGGGLRTKVISSQSQICSVKESERVVKKSFIQQRVEKLYGNAEGVVISKQIHNSNERKYLNNIANENVSKSYAASVHLNGNGNVNNGSVNNGANGVGVGMISGNGVTTKENLDENNKQIEEETDLDSLPVLRHLRPEFRAQLQIFSPKKVPKSSPNRSLDGNVGISNRVNGNNNHIFSNGDLSHHHHNNSHSSLPHVSSNGKIITSSSNSSNIVNSSSIVSSSSSSNGTSSSILSSSSLVQHQQLLQQQQQQKHKSSATRTIEEQQREEEQSSIAFKSMMETTSIVTSTSSSSSFQQQQQIQSTESSSASSSSLLSSVAVTSPPPSSSSHEGDAEAGPTTAANNSSSTTTTTSRESRSTKLKSSASAPVPESAPIEKVEKTIEVGAPGSVAIVLESNPAAVSQQQPEVQKMKLSETTTTTTTIMTNGDGDVGKIMMPPSKVIRNGTTNGHHPEVEGEDDKENVNGMLPSVAAKEVTNGKHPSEPELVLVRDGNYFLQVLKNEQNRLLTMAADIEREVEQVKTDGVDISEEVAGYVLVAAGKARLLCSQKMKQFEGLCYTNLNQIPGEKFQTTCEDLRGFWDMVMLQVDNVDASFREIDSFRRNGWKKPAPVEPVPPTRTTARTSKLLVKRPFKSSANGDGSSGPSSTVIEAKKAAAAAAAAKRDAQRKQLMELKRKQKMASSSQDEKTTTAAEAEVEIFVPGAAAAAVVMERTVDAS
ncbi:disks large-associated protein 4 [Uranotaenia lowii]|uniref:disks large-associated protein 4 n=1 Tax=Uranotaenia lowii TaxID=190385 RepID=UPI002479DD6B|nr:disks large-associated protein 4 [Uranotaenia lowii]